jgi:hypothetical protein
MASLTITRDSGYADRLRAYEVILDGKKVGEIRNGETKEFSLGPGKHRLSLKIDWCGSKSAEFAIAEADRLTFHAKSSLRGGRLYLALWYTLVARDSYLRLEQTPPKS